MNVRLSSIIATLGCIFLVSCYPYDEGQHKKPKQQQTKQKTVTTPEQQKIQEQRDQLKATEEAKKKQEELKNPLVENPGTTTPPNNPPNNTPKPPIDEKRTEYAVASKVPGKEGYVFSPYNNKLVDVRDIPSGTLVQDPTYTGAGKGYFRVP